MVGTPCTDVDFAFLVTKVLWTCLLCAALPVPTMHCLSYGFESSWLRVRPLKLQAYVVLNGSAGSDGRLTNRVTLPRRAGLLLAFSKAVESCWTNQLFKGLKKHPQKLLNASLSWSSCKCGANSFPRLLNSKKGNRGIVFSFGGIFGSHF